MVRLPRIDVTDETLVEQAPVLLRVTAAGMVFTLIHGLLFELTHTPVRMTLVVSAAYAVLLLHYVLRRRVFITAIGTALVTLFGCLAIQYAAGGIISSGVNCIWAIGATLMGAVLLGGRYARPAVVLFVGVTVTALIVEFIFPPQPLARPAWALALNALVNVAVLGIISTEALAMFIRQRDRARAQLAEEHLRSEELLERILPAQIVRRLKSSSGTIADRLVATILFADVVGFTPMARKETPERTVQLLDELFSAFDAVVERFGLEKIKTIGDAYMVAGGVPEPRPDHAHAVASLALEFRVVAEKFRNAQGVDLRLRIGMHTGPVIAGVIGRKRFTYDLWGDTVNVASRMESHGEPGEIQVTEAVYEALKGRFNFEPRGAVNVKGIGELKAWLLKT